ncbi:MAG: hypothetical protein R3Y24_13545 [Eubacteriales bacterium]
MEIRDVEKCKKILGIFYDVILLKEDFYYAYDASFGYILFQYVGRDGVVESAVVCKTPKELYEYLQKDWKYDIVNDYMAKQDIYEFNFEVVMQNLPDEITRRIEEQEEKHLEALQYI